MCDTGRRRMAHRPETKQPQKDETTMTTKTLPITRCEKCGREENGKHDDRACLRCNASANMQFVRWVKVANSPATVPFSCAAPFAGITGEKWTS